MFVAVDLESKTHQLCEAGDCKRFHIAVTSTGPHSIESVVEVLGDLVVRSDPDHIWLAASGIRSRALGTVGPGWEEDFAAMVAYADSKGWVDQGGIRAPLA